MFSWYGEFIILPDEVKKRNKIKLNPKCPRFDCIKSTGYYKGIKPFVNSKGMLKFNLMRTDRFEIDENRKADYYLQGEKSMNFTSIYHLNIPKGEHIAFGEPNNKDFIKLKGEKTENPMLAFKNDGYIFLIKPDYTKFELLIIENGRYLIQAYTKQAANGEFTGMIEHFRKTATLFHNY